MKRIGYMIGFTLAIVIYLTQSIFGQADTQPPVDYLALTIQTDKPNVGVGQPFYIQVALDAPVVNPVYYSGLIKIGEVSDGYLAIRPANGNWTVWLTHDNYGKVMFSEKQTPWITSWTTKTVTMQAIVRVDVPMDYNLIGEYQITGYLVPANLPINGVGTSVKINVINNPETVLIRAGTFMMGSSDSGTNVDLESKPQHQVTISKDFYMGKYEVTNTEYCVFLNDGNSDHYHNSLAIEKLSGIYTPRSDKKKVPVDMINWTDATHYCQWLSTKIGQTYRLPTEAEWEYSCRAGTTTKYFWGDNFEANKASNSGTGTISAGSFPPNPWGLYDMHGNAWEWCEDDWHSNYQGASNDGSAWVDNPRGNNHVLRGGSYLSYGYDKVFSSYERSSSPSATFSAEGVGFRVVRNLEPIPGPTPTPSDGLPAILPISGGTFQMGDIFGGGGSFELPVHNVTLSTFYMGKYEVTNAEYCIFLNAGGNSDHFNASMSITNSSGTYAPTSGRELHPVVYVSWTDATHYCNWLTQKTGKTYSLPTEAEWEYACRAGTTTQYSWGNSIDPTKANYQSFVTTPVGSYSANPWGLYDMHGNAFEWCRDWFDGYSSEAQADPTGPASGTYRVLRGGGWNNDAGALRSSNRGIHLPDGRSGSIGFRVVRS